MKAIRKLFLSISVLTLAAGFSSCVTTEQTPDPNNHTGYDHTDQPPSIPSPQWELHPSGNGYDLDLIVNGREHHVDHGGEYMDGHRVRGNTAVPTSAISAFEVDMPDGEAMLYWVEPHGGQLAVYSSYFDPMTARYDSPGRKATIRY
jgi:hypothetical protein